MDQSYMVVICTQTQFHNRWIEYRCQLHNRKTRNIVLVAYACHKVTSLLRSQMLGFERPSGDKYTCFTLRSHDLSVSRLKHVTRTFNLVSVRIFITSLIQHWIHRHSNSIDTSLIVQTLKFSDYTDTNTFTDSSLVVFKFRWFIVKWHLKKINKAFMASTTQTYTGTI